MENGRKPSMAAQRCIYPLQIPSDFIGFRQIGNEQPRNGFSGTRRRRLFHRPIGFLTDRETMHVGVRCAHLQIPIIPVGFPQPRSIGILPSGFDGRSRLSSPSVLPPNYQPSIHFLRVGGVGGFARLLCLYFAQKGRISGVEQVEIGVQQAVELLVGVLPLAGVVRARALAVVGRVLGRIRGFVRAFKGRRRGI